MVEISNQHMYTVLHFRRHKMKKFREEEECHEGTATNRDDSTGHSWLGKVFRNFPINIQPVHKSNHLIYSMPTDVTLYETYLLRSKPMVTI